jgi:aminoglycoside phosphotransferase (APT) family kinase protein
MIPQDKRAAVSRGLRGAFGVTDFEEIRQLTKGLSPDLVFRIVVKRSPYLLRIVTRVNIVTDPARHFATMKMAAEAGIAPRVWYANVEDGISIIDFVDPAPFPRTEALVRVPAILRRLHALPPFPNTFNYVTAHDRFIWKFQTANLLPADEIGEVFARYIQVCATYPRLDEDMVSSHSDLKPENILFDGQRVWLVDWQAAFVNDRYFDLSVVANFVVTNDGDERIYLETYFGHAPDEYQLARFFLMRQVVHMFYAAVFLILASAGRPIHRSETLPTFREFHERLWSGIDLADNDVKIVYGLIHWEQLRQNVARKRFDEALQIVAERNAQESVCLLLPAAPTAGHS